MLRSPNPNSIVGHGDISTVNTPSKGYTPSGPLDPVAAQIAAFFAADPGWEAMTTRPPAETRAAIRAATPVLGLPGMEHVEDFPVPVAGGAIGLRFYRPVSQPHALIIWAHGGGFTLGSLDEIDNFARALAKTSGCAIASVDYRLAPDYKFPTAVEDMQAATLWVAQRLVELAGGAVPIFLGGDSAGANLATVVTRRLHATKALAIAGNVLAYPNTDSPDAASLRRFKPPFLGLREVRFFLDLYLPDAAARLHPDFAPLHAGGLDVLPPTLIITAEHDIITEQAEDYGRKLAEQGVTVQAIRYPGMIHGFVTMDAFFPSTAGAAMRAINAFVAGLAARA
jgi:acetyl esterase